MTPSFDAFMEQGLDASRRDEAESAVKAWQAAASADPRSALPHFLMGAEFAQAGRLADAEAAFANAVILAPQFDTARYQLGLLQFTSGRAAAAQVTWEALFKLASEHPLRCFVDGFTALAQDDFDSALRHFQAGIAVNRSNPPMNADIGRVIDAIHRLREPGRHVAASSDDGHVLLAAYRQQGVAH